MVELVPQCPDELSEVRRLFHEIDADGDGELSMAEILDGMSGCFKLGGEELEQLLNAVDLNLDGVIEEKEWVSALTDWAAVQKCPEWEDIVDSAFDALGSRDEGPSTIDSGTLEQILPVDGCKIMPHVFKDTMRLLDTNHDGRICLKEFRAMLMRSELDLDLFSSRL